MKEPAILQSIPEDQKMKEITVKEISPEGSEIVETFPPERESCLPFHKMHILFDDFYWAE